MKPLTAKSEVTRWCENCLRYTNHQDQFTEEAWGEGPFHPVATPEVTRCGQCKEQRAPEEAGLSGRVRFIRRQEEEERRAHELHKGTLKNRCLDDFLPGFVSLSLKTRVRWVRAIEARGEKTATPEEFISDLYQVLLGRLPGEFELNYWLRAYTKQPEDSASKAQLLEAFAKSTEVRSREQ